jgi:hypothetical protein
LPSRSIIPTAYVIDSMHAAKMPTRKKRKMHKAAHVAFHHCPFAAASPLTLIFIFLFKCDINLLGSSSEDVEGVVVGVVADGTNEIAVMACSFVRSLSREIGVGTLMSFQVASVQDVKARKGVDNGCDAAGK